MESEVAYPLGWGLVLLLAALAVRVASKQSARERAARRAAEVLAAGRRDTALALLDEIEDGEVREAWPLVAAVLEEGALTDGRDVRALAATLAAGGARQLAEEVAIEVSDESNEQVVLYHMRFVPPTVTCPRDALVLALGRLADALDELDASAR